MKPRRVALLVAGLLLAAGCGGGGDGGGGEGGDRNLTFWLAEDVAQRVSLIQQIVDGFSDKTGIQVKVAPIPENQFAGRIR